MELSEKKILIIGGTGSFGSAFLFHLLETQPALQKILIFSRDEQKQFELRVKLTEAQRKKVDFFIGDVRDKDRLDEVMHGVDIVIHAAAMKHMPIAEVNPEECYKTNVEGTRNVVNAALSNRVDKVVALSTDKAVMPINVYGASKFLLERTIIQGNRSPRNNGTKLCAVRYANVLGSRGSVVPFFQKMKVTGELPITDYRMSRFSITMKQGIDIVMSALQISRGGEIFVPKTPSYAIKTVAEAIAPECKQVEIGIRNSEKLSELLVCRHESSRTLALKQAYVILPENYSSAMMDYYQSMGVQRVVADFEYDSATNDQWLSVEELRNQIIGLDSIS